MDFAIPTPAMNFRPIFIVLAVFVVILLSPGAYAVRNGEVVNGEDVAPASRFTALIKVYNDKGEFIKRCSGVLIDTQAVMTAAHCFPQGSALVFVEFGLNEKDPSRVAFTSTAFSVHPQFTDLRTVENALQTSGQDLPLLPASLEVNPNFYLLEFEKQARGGASNFKIEVAGIPNLPYHDFALIFLRNKTPEHLSPIKFARSFKPNYGETLYSYGFGLFGIKFAMLDDQLRKTETSLTSIVMDGESLTHLTSFGFGTSNVCIGDSGGPVLIQDVTGFRLAGIFSAQDNGCYGYNHFAVPQNEETWIQAEAKRYIGRELRL